jgi:hypothetical protein
VLPNSDLCIADSQRSRLVCYNLAADYAVSNNRVVLKSSAVAHLRPLAKPQDVDRWTCTDAQGWANIKAWGQAMADKYASCSCN